MNTADIYDLIDQNNARLLILEKELDIPPALVKAPIVVRPPVQNVSDTTPAPAPDFSCEETLEPENDLFVPLSSYEHSYEDNEGEEYEMVNVNEVEDVKNDVITPEAGLNTTPENFEIPTFYTYGGRRYDLICEGVCISCAHCGIKLTDAVSLERGIGLTCSKRGYLEDPVSSDELQAFIDLAEFPQLCEYLTAKYKPLGVRGLMNGLVKIASLNRRATGLHSAVCDAVDSLGYKRLASTLRESIAVLEIKDSVKDPTCFAVWVKKSDWNWSWSNDLKLAIGLGRWDRMRPGDNKGVLVPKKYKKALWELMLKHYAGFAAKTPSGTIKITRVTTDNGSSSADEPVQQENEP